MTLCLNCKKVYTCPFHRTFYIDEYTQEMHYKEVEGWTIQITATGVMVTDCPQFRKETYSYKEIVDFLGISGREFDKNKTKYIKALRKYGIIVRKRGNYAFNHSYETLRGLQRRG